jgi:hypothetical protein
MMPHDLKGRVLSVGDTVILRCKVKEIHNTEEYCNATLETLQPMFPGENRTGVTVNTKQTEKSVALEPESLARSAYAAYGKVTDFKNFRGEPMPAFDALPSTIQAAWFAACGDVLHQVNESH